MVNNKSRSNGRNRVNIENWRALEQEEILNIAGLIASAGHKLEIPFSKLRLRNGEIGFDLRTVDSSRGYVLLRGETHLEVSDHLARVKHAYTFYGYLPISEVVKGTPYGEDGVTGDFFALMKWRVA